VLEDELVKTPRGRHRQFQDERPIRPEVVIGMERVKSLLPGLNLLLIVKRRATTVVMYQIPLNWLSFRFLARQVFQDLGGFILFKCLLL
jgi:hypothetical protein